MNMNVYIIAVVIAGLALAFLDKEELKSIVDEELYHALSDVSPTASQECLELAVATMQGEWYATDAETANCARDAINKLTVGN